MGNSKTVLFDIQSSRQIGLASLETGEWKVLLEGTFPKYSPSGHVVFWRPNSLWAVPFDASAGEVRGTAVQVLSDISFPGLHGTYDIADDGTLVTSPWEGSQLMWVDRTGQEVRTVEAMAGHPRISPDGGLLAFRFEEIWVQDLERGTRQRLDRAPSTGVQVWSPNGERIAYTPRGQSGISLKRADGTGERELLYEHVALPEPSSWSPDGQWLAFNESGLSRKTGDIWLLSMEGERRVTTLIGSEANEQAAAFSPNGRFIAYVSDASGQNEVYVQGFPEAGTRVTVSTGGGAGPVWSRDGRELFYARGSQMWSVPIEMNSDGGLEIGVPRELFDGPYSLEAGHPHYDVAEDDRFLVTRVSSGSPTFTVIVNWQQRLRELVPRDN